MQTRIATSTYTQLLRVDIIYLLILYSVCQNFIDSSETEIEIVLTESNAIK